jgi:mono/diheme cytochrome c family protein
MLKTFFRTQGKVAAMLLIASCMLAGFATRAQDSASGANGGTLFVANGCYQCHGYEGQGGEAPRIAPTAYPMQAFMLLVRHPASEMPAYSPEVLSDEDLQEIYAYIRSRPEPPPVSDIGILKNL